jgi:hypothetical protein
MKKHTQQWSVLTVMGLLLASCGSMQPVSQVRDDIYFMPSEAPMTASVTPTSPEPHELNAAEDYFDESTSEQLGTSRSYYDMAYNDPHYYNYGRFGFGSGMGMGGMGMGGMGMGGMGMGFMSGWNGPGWGMGMGYGWGTGMGNMGWGSPYGWYDPWDPWNRWDPWNPFNRWNQWDRWNRPWGFGTTHYGMGNYWGPFGNCMTCYAPVVIGGSSNTYFGHRSSLGSGSNSSTGGGNGTYRPRMPLRDPVSLDPQRREAARPRTATPRNQYQGREQDRSFPGTTSPGSNGRFENAPRTTPQQERGGQQQRSTPRLDRGTEQRTTPSRTSPQRSSPERSAPSRGGGFDRGGSSPSIGPSRSGGGSGGGGGRPSGTPRPR